MMSTPMMLWDFKRKLKSHNHGFATAEFAIVLPAVVLITGIFMWILSLCITQIKLESAAHVIARQESRGTTANNIVNELKSGGFSTQVDRVGEFVEVTVEGSRKLLSGGINFTVNMRAKSVAVAETN